MRKFWWGVLCLLVIGAGAYFLTRTKSFVVAFPNLDFRKSQFSPQVIGTQLTERVVKAVTEQGKAFVAQTLETIKKKTFQTFEQSVNQKMADLGKSLGAEESVANVIAVNGVPKEAVRAVPIVFAFKVGAKAYFAVKNESVNSALHYIVDWGDGVIEQGDIASHTTQTLSHSWSKAGEYAIDFQLLENNTPQHYTIIISIF